MSAAENILVVIPARGGSKGIPRKNLQLVAGKPLIAHTIEHARQAETPCRIVVSTDDLDIAQAARQAGAEVVDRPAELSGDTASSESALLHVLDVLEAREGYVPELLVFLQATAPIRQSGDLDRAVAKLRNDSADSLLSVVPTHRFLWRVTEAGPVSFNYDYMNRPRRQDRPAEFLENGSIYVVKPWVLRSYNNRLGGRITLYEMDENSAVDVDTPHDLGLCEFTLMRASQAHRAREESLKP